MKYEFMKNHSKEFCLDKMASILRVSRAGYYKFLNRALSQREIENEKLTAEIKEIHDGHRKVYGSPKVHQELFKKGRKVSRKRVARLMRKAGIQSKRKKAWKITTKRLLYPRA